MPNITCPKCSAQYNVPGENIGRKVQCANCHHIFVAELPAVEDEEAPPPGLLPVLTRRATPPDAEKGPAVPIDLTSGSAGDSSSDGRYGWCRWLQGAFSFFGVANLLFALLAFGAAVLALGNNSLDGFVVLLVAGFGMIVTGFVQFALSELLGGVVAFLTKHDCYP
jgi:predicted Zn finger-like uncharacterized protein